MSASFRVRVRVEQLTSPGAVTKVKAAIADTICWLEGESDEYVADYTSPGKAKATLIEVEGRTDSRDTTKDSKEVRDAVWKALDEFVPVEVLWWDDEREPDEYESFDDQDYEHWLDQQAEEETE